MTARDAVPGGAVDRRGVVVAVTFHGADDATVFRAELADDLPEAGQLEPQPVLHLVWHGRDRVPGVMPGAWMRVRGHVARAQGLPTVFNPQFHLLDEHRSSA